MDHEPKTVSDDLPSVADLQRLLDQELPTEPDQIEAEFALLDQAMNPFSRFSKCVPDVGMRKALLGRHKYLCYAQQPAEFGISVVGRSDKENRAIVKFCSAVPDIKLLLQQASALGIEKEMRRHFAKILRVK